MFYLVYSGGVGPSHQTLVQIRAARIAAVVNGVLEARSLDDALYVTKHANTEPVYVSWASPPPRRPSQRRRRRTRWSPTSSRILQKGWRLRDAAARARRRRRGRHLRQDRQRPRAALPDRALSAACGSLVLTQTLFTLGVITFIIVFVSAWAVRWVTSPLTSIASAARAFGRPGGLAGGRSRRESARSRSRRPRARSTRCASACAASSTSARACWSPSATICARR